MKEVKIKDLHSISLPKWPTILVKGNDLTLEQTMEVLIRTHAWHDFEHFIAQNEIHHQIYKNIHNFFWHLLPPEEQISPFDFFEHKKFFLKTLKALDLNYLFNRKIDSDRGWLNWDGKITTPGYVMSRWPNAHDLYQDVKLLTRKFKFITNFEVQLIEELDDEEYLILLNIKYENGHIKIFEEVEKAICDFKHYMKNFKKQDEKETDINSKEHEEKVMEAIKYVIEK